ILDPDVILLRGGMGNIDRLYADLGQAMRGHVFSDVVTTPVARPLHGDSSGVRGAAWLWPPAS
uniref:ROK family protein n=1 Tax=Klebsiella aerogenes TaxID=548 RepID=UPI0013D674F8